MDEVYEGRYDTNRAPWSSSWKPGDDPAAIRKTDNAHWTNRTLRQVATHPTIGQMAARLMKTPEVRLWHDQLLYKPGPGSGTSRSGNVG